MAGPGRAGLHTPDWRGMASSSVRASRHHDHGYRQLVEIDAPALVDQLTTRCFQHHACGSAGTAWAVSSATLIAAREPERFHGLLPVASGSVYLALLSHAPPAAQGIRLLGMLCAPSPARCWGTFRGNASALAGARRAG
jgi:hypothetical protein